MRVAVVGSRGLVVDGLGKYIPKGVSELISKDEGSVAKCVEQYAKDCGIKYFAIQTQYDKFGLYAVSRRNISIIESADLVIAFWDGLSNGTKFIIDNCKIIGIRILVYVLGDDGKFHPETE